MTDPQAPELPWSFIATVSAESVSLADPNVIFYLSTCASGREQHFAVAHGRGGVGGRC